MTSSGPLIEELPDDYDASADFMAPSTSSSSTAPAREVRSSTASSNAGLRKGFFNKSSVSSAAAVPERSVSSSAPSTQPVAPKERVDDVSATSAPEVAPPAATSQVDSSLASQEAEISSLLDSLRTQLRDVCTRNAARQHRDEGEPEALLELREFLSSSTQSQNRWPTAQARSALTKSSLEANTAMAEMRAASNDARRMRSGEEKKVITELRKATDEILERVRKVVDISAPKPLSEEDKARAVTAAFHSLPFTVKLRVLADERSALALFLVSFAMGVALVLGMLAEVYTAWGCGYSCGAI